MSYPSRHKHKDSALCRQDRRLMPRPSGTICAQELNKRHKLLVIAACAGLLTAGWWIPHTSELCLSWYHQLDTAASYMIHQGNIPLITALHQSGYKIIPRRSTYLLVTQLPPFWDALKRFMLASPQTVGGAEAGNDETTLGWRRVTPEGSERLPEPIASRPFFGLVVPSHFRHARQPDNTPAGP